MYDLYFSRISSLNHSLFPNFIDKTKYKIPSIIFQLGHPRVRILFIIILMIYVIIKRTTPNIVSINFKKTNKKLDEKELISLINDYIKITDNSKIPINNKSKYIILF